MSKLADHPAIQESWSNLLWSPGDISDPDPINPLDSVLKNVTFIKGAAGKHHLQLTRAQDGAIAALWCCDNSLVRNLEETLLQCLGQTIREIGERTIQDDLTLP
ncbi:MAG: hypothetical protein WCA22_16245 [Candidatus Binatus sp.]